MYNGDSNSSFGSSLDSHDDESERSSLNFNYSNLENKEGIMGEGG